MNYSEMSGYEINNRVHNVLVCNSKYDLTVDGYRVAWKDRETGKEIVTLRKEYDKQFKNYIDSWDDAGPIIFANRIAISAPTMVDDTKEWLAYPADDCCICELHQNPLRAAMIVFLIMREGE